MNGQADNLPPSDTAKAAWNTAQQFLVFEAGDPAFADWSVDNIPEAGDNPLDADGLDIYDIFGNLMYRDHVCTLVNGKQMRVRAAADTRLAAAVPNISIVADPWPIDRWIAAASKFAEQNKLTVVAGPKKLVCYCYPKLGLMCTGADGSSQIVDLSDLSVIRTATAGVLLHGDNPNIAWSPLQGAVAPQSLHNSAVAAPAGAAPEQNLVDSVKLFAQMRRTYCAVASGQMILDFHKIDKVQDDIALVMQTGVNGTDPDLEVLAYPILTNNGFDAQLYKPPSFEVARTEINAGRPLKSGITGHARVAVGWKTNPGDGGSIEQWLFIHDPWPVTTQADANGMPVGGGAQYWERWEAPPCQPGKLCHTNFTSVKPAATS